MTDTDTVIAGMLVENTGRHFLDSGGAYGRMWERNQAAAGDDPVAWCHSRPEAWQGYKGELWGTIDLFHWMRQRAEYHPDTDARWRRWVDFDYIGAEKYHRGRCYNSSGDLDDWLDLLVAKGWAERHPEFSGGYTYNEENALSQDIVWTPFTLTDDCPWVDFETEMIAVSVHNGCDARGGFTDYRMFEADTWGFLDYADYEITLECDRKLPDPQQGVLDGVPAPSNEPHQIYVSSRGGYTEWYDATQGDTIDDPEEIDDFDDLYPDDEYGVGFRCPCGEGNLLVTGYHAPYPS